MYSTCTIGRIWCGHSPCLARAARLSRTCRCRWCTDACASAPPFVRPAGGRGTAAAGSTMAPLWHHSVDSGVLDRHLGGKGCAGGSVGVSSHKGVSSGSGGKFAAVASGQSCQALQKMKRTAPAQPAPRVAGGVVIRAAARLGAFVGDLPGSWNALLLLPCSFWSWASSPSSRIVPCLLSKSGAPARGRGGKGRRDASCQ